MAWKDNFLPQILQLNKNKTILGRLCFLYGNKARKNDVQAGAYHIDNKARLQAY